MRQHCARVSLHWFSPNATQISAQPPTALTPPPLAYAVLYSGALKLVYARHPCTALYTSKHMSAPYYPHVPPFKFPDPCFVLYPHVPSAVKADPVKGKAGAKEADAPKARKKITYSDDSGEESFDVRS